LKQRLWSLLNLFRSAFALGEKKESVHRSLLIAKEHLHNDPKIANGSAEKNAGPDWVSIRISTKTAFG
jgi:hypothetical protein